FSGMSCSNPKNIHRLRIVLLRWIGDKIERVVQRYHREVINVVWDEHGAEIRTAGPYPVVGAMQRAAAGNFLARNVLGIGIDLVFELSGSVSGETGLVAESGRPCRKGINRRVVLQDGRVNMDDVRIVKLKSLTDGQTGIGILEFQLGRSAQSSTAGADI